MRTYTELSKLKTFKERYEYLRTNSRIGDETFGWERYLTQVFYRKSPEWKSVRNFVIARDLGCDLGIRDRPIIKPDFAIVHHMNTLTSEDIETNSVYLLDPEFLITTTLKTHNEIHYGDGSNLFFELVERTPNDTIPWKQKKEISYG